MMRSLVSIAVAACQQGAPPPPNQAPVSPAPRADAARASDARIDATLDAGDPTAHLFELPEAMATRDGKLVSLKVIDADGARGAPNLAFELRDHNDRTVERVVVISLDEEWDAATLAQHAASADKLIAEHDLIPLDGLERESDAEGHFAGLDMTVVWEHEHYTFTQHGAKLFTRAVPKAWRGTSYFSKLEDLTCNNPDFLSVVSVAPTHRLAVVDVAYKGNDTCWERTDQMHVVTW